MTTLVKFFKISLRISLQGARFMDYENIFSKMMIGEKYYTSRELKYDTSVGIFLSPYHYKQLLEYKPKSKFNNPNFYTKLSLKTFNGKTII